MNDVDLIYEAYITANWGYTNIDYPSNDKYGNIKTSKTSYYEKGKCPTDAGLATAYTVSQEDEELKLSPYVYYCLGNGNDKEGRSILIYIADRADNPLLKDEDTLKKHLVKCYRNAVKKHGIYWNALDKHWFKTDYIERETIAKLSEALENHLSNRGKTQAVLFFNTEGDDITKNINKLVAKYNREHKYDNQPELGLTYDK